ncbi:hypothetical protein J7K99_06870 [bacterium]|nr:hypothetical protein [bacterium]
MKRLLLVAAIAALAVMAWGQTWTSTADQSPDTVWIHLNVTMVGVQWTFNYGGVGGDNTYTGSFTYSVSGDTFEATGSADVHTCDVIHHVFWIENVGGMTMDFNTYLDEGLTGPTWSHDNSNITCATINAEDTIGGAYTFEASDGAVSHSGSWTVLPEDLGSDEYENLVAEDPSSPGEGTWGSESDQVEYHLELVMPISSSTTAAQDIYVCVIGKISD